jgi:predicted metalloprotease with PDZ domain
MWAIMVVDVKEGLGEWRVKTRFYAILRDLAENIIASTVLYFQSKELFT